MSAAAGNVSPKPRKSRAIGLLTSKILAELPDAPEDGESWEISIEQVVQRLEASRGSVYEVFHVFESILLVTKIGTNTYRWNGVAHLTKTLAFLRLIAVMLDVPGDMRRVRDNEVANLVKQSEEKDHLKSNPMMSAPAAEDAFVTGMEVVVGSAAAAAAAAAAEKVPKIHILRVCQKFVMLFLVAQQPKTMSLEFASKVIHGIHLPEAVLKSRTRRLYDISNVLTSLRCPLMVKVNMTSLNSPRKTAIQYRGPDVELTELNAVEIMLLPDYRTKHLYFDHGKSVLGIPERPSRIPRLTTIRLRPVEDDVPKAVDPMYGGLHLERMAITDLRRPFPVEHIAQLEAMRLNVKLRKPPRPDQPQTPAVATPNEQIFDTMWMAIIPGQDTLLRSFEPPAPVIGAVAPLVIYQQQQQQQQQSEEANVVYHVCVNKQEVKAEAGLALDDKEH